MNIVVLFVFDVDSELIVLYYGVAIAMIKPLRGFCALMFKFISFLFVLF